MSMYWPRAHSAKDNLHADNVGAKDALCCFGWLLTSK